MLKARINLQLIYLFLGSFTILFVGMGLFPLLPLYFSKFGANKAMIGVFFGLIYIANAAGPMTVGWLSDRLSRRAMFIASAALGLPALILLGQATTLWQGVLLTGVVWYTGGLCLALISVFTGLHTRSTNRGKSFSLVSLSIPLGSLIGGATIGYLVGSYGYGLLFLVLGAVWSILPFLGWLFIRDVEPETTAPTAVQTNQIEEATSSRYYLLLVASILSATTIATGRLGTSLAMQNMEFTASAIASSATISGLVAIPFTLLIGMLSDRLGRQHFLVLTYLLAAGGALALSRADQLWHFWLVATLTLVAFVINGAMSSALVTDLLPKKKLSRGISWINTANSAGAILSFMVAGYLMEVLGPRQLFLIASALPILSAALVEVVKTGKTVVISGSDLPETSNRSLSGMKACPECI